MLFRGSCKVKKNPIRRSSNWNKDIQCYREKSGWFLNSSQIVGYMLCFVIRWDMQRETCWRQRNTANHYLCECVIVCMFDLVLCSICLLHWSCASILIVFGSTDWQKRIGLVGVCWHVGMLNGKQIKHFKNEKTRYFHWISTFAMTAIFWNVLFFAGVWVFRENNEKLPLTKTFSYVLMFSFTIQCGQMYRASLKIWSRSKQKEHFVGKKK